MSAKVGKAALDQMCIRDRTHPGVAASMFEALYDAGVNIKMISTSEIRVTVLIDEKYTERALNAVHDKFALGD